MRKVSGYQATGHIVAIFQTRGDRTRVVFEFEAIPGLLHIFAPDQIELVP